MNRWPRLAGVLALAGALAIVLGGPMGSMVSAAPPLVSPAVSSTATLQPLMASTQLWVGENDLLIDLLDADGARFAEPAPSASAELIGPDGQTRAIVPLGRIRLTDTGRFLYRGRGILDVTGSWVARVSVVTATGDRLEGATRFEVLVDGGTPALGQPAIPVQTPTVATNQLASITSDWEPVPQLYWWSLDEALAAGRPILYVIDTRRPGVGDGCGSAMGEARVMRGSFPGLVVIHAEPFISADGTVVVGSDQVATEIAPWAAAWGVTAPPWMFVIAADGAVTAKFQGVFGTDELLSALRQVAAYSPGRH
ncbi:MAG: hypothetical protein KF809_18105 [Chloroflexi bacterium]|nr:hypothetical protein [Chloroflexota bacterium]